MSPFTVVVLICSMSLSHEQCQIDTSVDAIPIQKVENEHQCGFFGQATIASTALAPRVDEEYVKIICTRNPHKKAFDKVGAIQ